MASPISGTENAKRWSLGHFVGLSVAVALNVMAPSVSAAQHEFGHFQIHVAADDAALTPVPDYQITVEDDELMLTRLTANFSGQLSNSFVADLNQDGAFEVVVTYSYDNGHKTGVHLYSWHENRLQPHKVAALDDAQLVGYRGNDEFAVANGQLVRIFQLYELAGEEWQATAQQRRLRYSFDDARWLSD